MTFIEQVEYTTKESLYYINKYNYIQLYDKVKGFLGNVEVWHDSAYENAEYINLNGEKVYIETIEEY